MENFAFKLNYEPSPPDARDYLINIDLAKISAAPQVDLSDNCTSVKNQGQIGACTAFTGVGAMEYIQKKYNAKSGDIYSERFLYYTTRVNVEGKPATSDTGAYIRDVIKSVVRYGVCKESTFPYNGDYKMAPPSSAYAEATKFQVLRYGRFSDGTNSIDRQTYIKQIKANLEFGFPVMVGFTVYSSINSVGADGVVPMPGGTVVGGHAVLLVGYDDSKQLFKFKNSWGSTWGDNGYGYLPYQYYFSGNMQDCWSIYQEEDNDLKVIGVDVNGPPTPGPDPTDQRLSDVKSIFGTILNRVSTLSTASGLPETCTDLIIKYQQEGNFKMYNLVSNIKMQFTSIAQP